MLSVHECYRYAIVAACAVPTCIASAQVHCDGIWIAGHCVTVQSHPHNVAFRWSEATGVSRLGAVVVGFGRIAELHSTPFVWDQEHGMQNLEALLANQYDLVLDGWTLGWARRVAVNPRQITFIGEGTNADGGPEGWIARIPRACTADTTGDLIVDLQDLLAALGAWGA